MMKLYYSPGACSLSPHIVAREAELDASVASQKFLMGDSFTVADAYAFTVVNWCKYVRIDTTKYGHLCAYMQRIAERTAVRLALEAEGLIHSQRRSRGSD